jgi:RNA polymerase sigma-70 factor (ECF subfamily)
MIIDQQELTKLAEWEGSIGQPVASIAGDCQLVSHDTEKVRFALIPVGFYDVLPSMRNRLDSESETSDEVLLSGIVVGDDQAGLTFVRRFQRRLFGLAMGIVNDASLAEDVAQEAFIRIFRHAAVFDARRGSVATWSLAITRNLAIDATRVRQALPVDPDDRVFLELTSRERQPDDSAVTSDAVARAKSALATLPFEQRRAVVLATMYGRTAEEVSASEAIPLGTAKSRIRLGMAKLREAVIIVEGA